MRYGLLLILILTIIRYNHQQFSTFDNYIKIEKNSDSVKSKDYISPECIQRDTITPLGTKIHYNYKDDKFQISCSSDKFKRTYDSLYTCNKDENSGVWDFVPKLKAETKNNLIFIYVSWTSSGGDPEPLEFNVIVLPKNDTDSAYEKEFFIGFEKGYLVYDDSKNNEIIYLLNVETKKLQTITLVPKQYLSRSPTLNIQEIKIVNNEFKIKYESLDKNDEIYTVNKTFKMKI